MNRSRALLRAGLLALFAGHTCFVPTLAQSNACPPVQKAEPRGARVVVDQVEFQGDNPLSESERADVATEIQQNTLYLGSGQKEDDWVGVPTEVVVRGALQKKGYFRALIEATPYLIRADGQDLHYALRIRVESGPQYRLGEVHFKSEQDTPLAVSEAILRQQLDLQKGELFDVSKVRRAMDDVTKLYACRGNIDEVTEPQIQINDQDPRIDLTFRIDEGKAYHISGIDLVGADTEASRQLRLPQTPGDLIDMNLWRKFFEDNASDFPDGATPEWSLRMSRDTRESAVRITVDFHACPESPPAHVPKPVLQTKTGP